MKVDFFSSGRGVTIASLIDAGNTLSLRDLFTIFLKTGISEWSFRLTIVVEIGSSTQDFEFPFKIRFAMSVSDIVENVSNTEVQGRPDTCVADPVTEFSSFLIFEILSEK